jgi:putative DNA methylase
MAVVAAHPIKAEMSGASPKAQTREPINYDAILVCKKRATSTKISLDNAVQATLVSAQKKLCSLTTAYSLSTLSKRDCFVVAQSQALCVFSQHVNNVADASGKVVSLSQFLAATSSAVDTEVLSMMKN